MPPLDRLVPGLIGLLLFGLPTVWLARQAWLAHRSRRWPSVAGRVVSSEVRFDPHELGRSRGFHAVRYEYTVQGNRYTGSRVRFGGWLASSPEQAARVVDRYRPGVVSVRYDPERPWISTLERRASRLVWFFMGLGVFFVITIAGALVGWWE